MASEKCEYIQIRCLMLDTTALDWLNPVPSFDEHVKSITRSEFCFGLETMLKLAQRYPQRRSSTHLNRLDQIAVILCSAV